MSSSCEVHHSLPYLMHLFATRVHPSQLVTARTWILIGVGEPARARTQFYRCALARRNVQATFRHCCAVPNCHAAPPVESAHRQPHAAPEPHTGDAPSWAPLYAGQRVESPVGPHANDASAQHAAEDATRARPTATAALKRRGDAPVQSARRSALVTTEAAAPTCVLPSAKAANSGARPRDSPPATPAAGHARKRGCARRSADFETPPIQRAAAASAPHGACTLPCAAHRLDHDGWRASNKT